jgi:chaperonin GroEL
MMTIYQKSKAKQVVVDNPDFRKKVAKTLHDMAAIVASSLGPAGRVSLIERDGLSPLATKDGVTIVKALGSADPVENVIIDACKEISINTATEAGDGTTTAMVLASALVDEGHIFINEHPKYSAQKIMNELRTAYETVIVPYLKEVASTVETEDQLLHVALISANNDSEVAKAAVAAVLAAGDNGHVLIGEGISNKIEVETSDGYIVTTGLKDLKSIGPAFINDKQGQRVTVDDGLLFLYNGSMSDLKSLGYLQGALESSGYDGSPIIVVAHEFGDVVLDKMLSHCKTGTFIIPMKSARSGLPNGAAMFLDDVAAYSGATVYSPVNLEDVEFAGLGKFHKLNMNMYEAFIQCTPDMDKVNERISQLKAISEAASELDKSHLKASIAKLSCGISTIRVGGSSDLEIRERKARVEDAVEAVKSAIAEGVVTGGGTIHVRLSHVLNIHKDHKPSWIILEKALRYPLARLLENCGEDIAEVIGNLWDIDDESDMLSLPKKVFNVYTHTYEDPIEAGIIEPTKVLRVSIGNALSVASLIMGLGGVIVSPRDGNLELQMELADHAFRNALQQSEDFA